MPNILIPLPPGFRYLYLQHRLRLIVSAQQFLFDSLASAPASIARSCSTVILSTPAAPLFRSTCLSASHMFFRSTTASNNCSASGPELSLVAVTLDAPKPSLSPIPSATLRVGVEPLSSSIRVSAGHRNLSLLFRYFMFGPSVRSNGPTMPSADFCNSFPSPLDDSSS